MSSDQSLPRGRLAAPPLIVLCALLAAFVLMTCQPQIDRVEPEKILPTVHAQRVVPAQVTMVVEAQGLVRPHKQIELASEIAGRVTWVNRSLIAGGTFDRGDPLLRIADTDYRLQLEQAQAADERSQLVLEIAQRKHRRQLELVQKKLASENSLDDATQSLKLAEATRKVAAADLKQASINLQRTEITAPFTGRVQSESIDEGGYLRVGSPIATLYADDVVEVRLPIANRDLSFLDWPAEMRGMLAPEQAAAVTIRSSYGGVDFEWPGSLVRIESEVDTSTRLFYAVAEVSNPNPSSDVSPPLTVGLFVDAQIAGRSFDDIIILPRNALVGNQVLVVDAQSRLRRRTVDVLRVDADTVYISAGLNSGEWVCTSPPSVVVDGMQVQVAGRESLSAASQLPASDSAN